MKRNIVVFINPPNTYEIVTEETIVTNGTEHTDWANLPCLGILSLASYLRYHSNFDCIYLDGVVVAWDTIKNYLKNEKENIFAVCIGTLTASYGAAIQLFTHVKEQDKNIITIIGNDHFSAMTSNIFKKQRKVLDYGFIGNDVHRALNNLLIDLQQKKTLNYNSYPGLVFGEEKLTLIPSASEPINDEIDYTLIDKTFPHSKYYNANFQKRFKSRLKEKFGCDVLSGIPIELGRGCIKFANNNACTFCSIHHNDGPWRNALSAKKAWQVLEKAYKANYGYFYITADELPLTFGNLLKEMIDETPSWWKDIPKEKRPIMMGYARADGLTEKTAPLLKELGFKILMVGVDAGTPISLAAMNKPLSMRQGTLQAGEKLFQKNINSFEHAEKNGILIKVGFVIGHIGMNKDLLQKNIENMCHLLQEGKNAILSVDVEVLSPEPGSKDYHYLCHPEMATKDAKELGLTIAPEDLRKEISKKYIDIDSFEREEAMNDFIASVMPELTFENLANARDEVRDFAKSIGLLIGD